jgi:hypothetical protein
MLYRNIDDMNLLQISLDHESLKLEPKEKRLAGTMNMFDADLKGYRQDHQQLLELNGTIWEAVVLVQVHIKWTHLEECEHAEVYFHPQYHHLKKKKLE